MVDQLPSDPPLTSEQALLAASLGPAAGALKAWAACVNTMRSAEELRGALNDSLKEEAAYKGRCFKSGRKAIRWLETSR